jgi:hypothetical protein
MFDLNWVSGASVGGEVQQGCAGGTANWGG